MKRSQVNHAVQEAADFFSQHSWALPPNPKWDVTDFGLGDFSRWGLVLINLAEEEEYTEKLLYAVKDQQTPAHYHKQKKEDIIVRVGTMAIQLWQPRTGAPLQSHFSVQINGKMREVAEASTVVLQAGERITLTPGIMHAFWPTSGQCIIGEVSTANDDLTDNFFDNPDIGRFSEMVEDETPLVKLVSD